MNQAPPVPAANQSPYPLKAPPSPTPIPRIMSKRPKAAPRIPWVALLGAGAIAVIGGALLARRR